VLTGVRAEFAGLRTTGAYPDLFRALVAEARAALPAARELRVDQRDLELATPHAGGLRLDPTLETWGGVELVSDDGRTVRNTVEERLANAELLLRRRFAQRLATATEFVRLEPTSPTATHGCTPGAASSCATRTTSVCSVRTSMACSARSRTRPTRLTSRRRAATTGSGACIRRSDRT
jgi:hypothetical protein